MLLLVVFVVGMVGLPLAPPAAPKSGRFPCEDCPCGCATAEYCWDQCCCHSDREKLAWAVEQGVQPPDFLLARVAQADVSLASASTESCSCCSQASAQCRPPAATPDAANHLAKDVSSMRLVTLIDAAKCHGIDLIWTLLSSVTLENHSLEVALPQPPLLFTLPLDNESATSTNRCPDPPVP